MSRNMPFRIETISLGALAPQCRGTPLEWGRVAIPHIATVIAMAQATAETYRQLAKEARAEAAAAESLSSRRQWNAVAAHYDKLAVFVEKPKPRG